MITRFSRRYYFIFVLALFGCGEYSIRNIDKPAPSEVEGWSKSGATALDIKKALLECGAPSPSVNDFIYAKALGIEEHDQLMNHFFLTRACMERNGFVDRWRSVKDSCADSSFPEREKYPACQPNAVIPERSVERRLNSWYCKLKTDLNYCLEHALNSSACTREGKDYNNPPPECLP